MKPGDFLLGVMDFFAVLLPGSMATWIVTRYFERPKLLELLGMGGAPDATALWVVFLVASYFLGHIVFMAGSRLDPFYDRWRQRTKPTAEDHTFRAAQALKERLTADLKGRSFTVLKWCRAYIEVHAPGARAEIDRLEADSKFFRGMVVIAVLFGLHFLAKEGMPRLGAACLLLAIPAYVRFREQRWKMTELSYGTAVILGATKPGAAAPSAADEGDEGDESD